jgi:hypothetical protein
MGEFIIVRPAKKGLEHELMRLSFLQYAKTFSHFLSIFLTPHQLTDSDYDEGGY